MNTITTHMLTTKGQVTIPKSLRDKIGLKPGTPAAISLIDERTIGIRMPLTAAQARAAIGAPSSAQPLTAKESHRIASRGL